MTTPVLLITGASSGIGAATARLATRKGWRVILAARSQHAIHELATELGGPTQAVAAPCDIGDWDQVSTLPTLAQDTFGRLDAVFANAGYLTTTSFLHGTGAPQQWREMVLTNVYGTALVARATLPTLVRCRGHLIFTGSVTGRITVPGQLYSATKWAVTAMAQSIRAEVTSTGVRVTLIQPGLVDAGSPASHRPQTQHQRRGPHGLARTTRHRRHQRDRCPAYRAATTTLKVRTFDLEIRGLYV